MDAISSIVTMFNRLCIAMAYQQRYHKSSTWGSWAVFSGQTEFLFELRDCCYEKLVAEEFLVLNAGKLISRRLCGRPPSLLIVIHDPALATDMRCQYDDVLSCRVKFLGIAAAASLALARAYDLGTLLL